VNREQGSVKLYLSPHPKSSQSRPNTRSQPVYHRTPGHALDFRGSVPLRFSSFCRSSRPTRQLFFQNLRSPNACRPAPCDAVDFASRATESEPFTPSHVHNLACPRRSLSGKTPRDGHHYSLFGSASSCQPLPVGLQARYEQCPLRHSMSTIPCQYIRPIPDRSVKTRGCQLRAVGTPRHTSTSSV